MKTGIDGYTKTLGIIGNPVQHTLSPVIHNGLAELFGHNLVYVPFCVKQDLESAVKGAFALHLGGMNVTVPYKTEVLKYAVEIDDFAKQIGAANTLVRTEHGFKAYNTDILGLYRAMVSDGVCLEGEEVLILGAGGAARSAAMLALDKGAEHVYMLNRTIARAERVAQEVNILAGRSFVSALSLQDYPALAGKKYLCIQATSVGLYPHVSETVISEPAFYELIHTGYDIIYNPYETAFMSCVRAHGGKAFNGLKMLLYQGIIAYELWNDVAVSEDAAEQILYRLREALGL